MGLTASSALLTMRCRAMNMSSYKKTSLYLIIQLHIWFMLVHITAVLNLSNSAPLSYSYLLTCRHMSYHVIRYVWSVFIQNFTSLALWLFSYCYQIDSSMYILYHSYVILCKEKLKTTEVSYSLKRYYYTVKILPTYKFAWSMMFVLLMVGK